MRSLSLSAWKHWSCGLWHHALWQTGTCSPIIRAQDWDGKFHKNVYTYLPNYVLLHFEFRWNSHQKSIAMSNSSFWKSPPSPPKRQKTNFIKFWAERGRNHLQCTKPNVQYLLYCISMCHTPRERLQFKFIFLYYFHDAITVNKALGCRTCQVHT